MDTSTNIQNNNFNLWTNQQKQERTKNNISHYGIIKTNDNRLIKTFYTGIPDGKTFNGYENGTLLTSSRIEQM